MGNTAGLIRSGNRSEPGRPRPGAAVPRGVVARVASAYRRTGPGTARLHRTATSTPGLGRGAAGFTLIEVLAAMLLIGIVMPVVMQGVTSATRAGSASRHRTEAATLAGGKLSELMVTNQWNGGNLAGDFGADWPAYKWSAVVTPWAGDTQQIGLQQLDVTVTWGDGGRQTDVTVSGLAYVRPVPAT